MLLPVMLTAMRSVKSSECCSTEWRAAPERELSLSQPWLGKMRKKVYYEDLFYEQSCTVHTTCQTLAPSSSD